MTDLHNRFFLQKNKGAKTKKTVGRGKIKFLSTAKDLTQIASYMNFSHGLVFIQDGVVYACTKITPVRKTLESPDSLYDLSPVIVHKIMQMCRATSYTEFAVSINKSMVRNFVQEVERFDFAQKDAKNPLSFYLITDLQKDELDNILAIAKAINTAKKLINAPANICNIEYFLQAIPQSANTKIRVLRGKELKEKGFGCLVAVGEGAKEEPALAVVEYKGREGDDFDIALVGKGIVYDTGGLSIKPSQYMYGMHTDMGGAATILAAQQYLLSRKGKINFIAAYALAENAISNNSYRPGDILTSLKGTTVEIKDTDAEGRLVLCDALTYVQNTYKCSIILDMATLTGAAAYVGNDKYCAVMSNRTKLNNLWLKSAISGGNPAWSYPLMQDIVNTSLSSKRADIANCSLRGKAGHIIAGVFLQQFVNKNQDWIHIDIAGSCTDSEEIATGAPLNTLIEFIHASAKK